MLERVIRVVEAFAAGVLIAMLATVVHAEWFPWALVLALVTVTAFLTSLRMLSPDRLVTVSGAISVVVTVFIFSQQSSGGSVLIQADLAGTIFVFGTAVIAGLASAWPEIGFRARD
ncbi:MAG: hypothetical protein RLZZ40_1154 [Actinomycetota bacterium]|jgi:hypothetical protein